jgi:CheY-like chemotaxis protein
MKNLLPCKYPTTTLILDDNQSFLESVDMALSTKDRRLHFTTKPYEAIESITKSSNNAHFNFLRDNGDGDLELDYSKIQDIAKDPFRAHEISVLIVDYHMPEINGIDFCKRIKDSICQKILFTAHSNQDIAVNAVNNGLIQQYIQKHDPNVDKLLIEAIEYAEIQYATNKFNSVITSTKNSNGLFINPNLQAALLDFIQTEEIVEHYLLDQNGSLLCIDRTGQISKILVKHREDIRIPLTWREAEYLPKALAHEIWECKKTLCSSIDDVNFPPINLWEHYLIPTTKIPNESDCFLAIVRNPANANSYADISTIFLDTVTQ